MANDKPLKEYENLPTALTRIIIISLIMIGAIFLLAFFSIWPTPQLGIDWPIQSIQIQRILFISYMTIFISLWTVYFLSRSNIRFFHVKTLRRLLSDASEQWQDHININNPEDYKEFRESQHRKAQSTMIAIAIMIATSLILLGEIHNIALNSSLESVSTWQLFLLSVAAITALVSLICFIISVDAMDSLFNKFKTEEVARRLKMYFYKKTLNPKYFGLIFLLVSVVFIVAYYNLTLSCVVIGIFISIGYSHWFPYVTAPHVSKWESFMLGTSLISIALILKWCT